MLLLAGPQVRAAEPLPVYYFDRPPFYSTSARGRAQGILIERAAKAFALAKIDYRFRPLPSKRVLAAIRCGRRAAGLGWFRKPERESFAVFSRVLYRDQPLALVVNKTGGSKLKPASSLEAALKSGLRLGLKDGFSYGPWADGLIARHNPPRLELALPQANLMRMVAAGRMDFLLMNRAEADWLLSADPKLAERLEIRPLVEAPPGNTRHLMYSRSVEPELIRAVDRALESTAPSVPAAPPAQKSVVPPAKTE